MAWIRMALLLALPLLSAPAFAQSCQEDIAKLVQRREAVLAVINKSVKAGGGKLDPVSSCPRLRNLAAIEGEFVAYLDKNKDWCHVPDDAVANASASRAKMAATASRACGFAAQAARIRVLQRRQQQQQQQQAAGPQAPVQRLPAGPL